MNKQTDLEYYKGEVEFLSSVLSRQFDNEPIDAAVSAKEHTRLYRKVGKRFVPVSDPYAHDGLRDGFWLIRVEDGCTSIRQAVYPSRAYIRATEWLLENEIVEIIRKACEAKPSRAELTPAERRDWNRFIAKHGDSFNMLSYPSFQECAERIVEAIRSA